MNGGLIAFIAVYVVAVLASFFIYLVCFRRKRRITKRSRAAEAIIKDELLDHSVRNPYKAAFMNVPASAKMMLAVSMKIDGKKQEVVFDPSSGVYFGRGAFNKIRIYDSGISEKQGCFFFKNNRLWLQNMSGTIPVRIERVTGKSLWLYPGQVVQISDGDAVVVGGTRLEAELFLYDYNKR